MTGGQPKLLQLTREEETYRLTDKSAELSALPQEFLWLGADRSGFAYALSMISARRLGTTESASALAFWGNAVFLAAALVLSAILGSGAYCGEAHPSLAFLLRGWVMPTAFDAMLMMSCGVIAAAGLTLLTQAYRIAEASVVTPFEYTGMIW